MLRSKFAPIIALATGFLAMGIVSLPTPGDEKTDAQAPPAETAKKNEHAAPPETAEDRIRRALDERMTLSVEEAPLRDVVQHLREKTHINILIDRKALDDVGMTDDTPLNGTFRDISLRSILNLLLHPHDLAWIIDEGALTITLPEVAESHRQTKVYNVADLVALREGKESYDFESLITAITSTVHPELWDDVGGPGSIEAYRETITVSQTEDVQRKVAALLQALRKVKTTAMGNEASPQVSIRLPAEVEAKINLALQRPIALELSELPLGDLPSVLQEKLGIQAIIDTQALDDVGVAPGAFVSLSAEGMQGGQALSQLLRPLDLTWMVFNEVVLITTPEEVEAALEIRVYPMRDLLETVSDADELLADQSGWESSYDLIQTITGSIAQDAWDDVGGPGAIEFLPSANALVVSQTGQIHAQIEDFLTQLRQHLAEKPEVPQAQPKRSADALELVVYTLPVPQPPQPQVQTPAVKPNNAKAPEQNQPNSKPDALLQFGVCGGFGPGLGGTVAPNSSVPIPGDDLVEIIVSLVEPESWDREGVYIKAVPGRLIVRQNQVAQRKIENLLWRLGFSQAFGIGCNVLPNANAGGVF